jgi:signal transduction histidine kinase
MRGEEWDESIRHIVLLDAEVIHVERVSFWSLRPEPASIFCDAGYVAASGLFERGAMLLKSDYPAYFDAILEERVVDARDVYADPRTRELRDYCETRGISSMLDIPVWLNGQLVGVLCHEHVGAKRRWSVADEEFAASAGQAVASALAARARTRAEAAAQHAAFLDNISGLAHRSLDPHEIATRVIEAVVPRIADFAAVWALDHDGAIKGIGWVNSDPTKVDLTNDMMRDASESWVRHLVQQGQSLLLPEATRSTLIGAGIRPGQSARLLKLGIRTAMAVPLVTPANVVGLMAFCAARRHYDSDDLALAEGIGERVAGALHNAHLYAVARAAIRARDEFLVLAAHELRTPLTALQLMADDVLRRERRGGQGGEGAGSEAFARQVRRLGALVERMIDAARIRAEGVALTLEPCDLAAIVEARLKGTEERARCLECALTVRGQRRISGRWDRKRVEQLVDEVLDNAIKFGAGAPIEIEVGEDGTDAELTVRDHGRGIPAERLASIFSPFERSVPKEHFGGLGLGLYIAKAIAEAHGGSIVVRSNGGEGTTFVVRMPLEPNGYRSAASLPGT